MAFSAPIVTISPHKGLSRSQKIIGKTSPLSTEIEEFRGIPYGIVPARWEHSILRTSLPQDIYHAISNGPQCPQPPEFANSDYYQSHLDFPADVVDSEFDCLNLFIVRPSAAALARLGDSIDRERLPVLVWIHGGGFGFGASTDPIWDPSRLVMHSIVMGMPFIAVGINYRLGIFGFAASTEIMKSQSESNMKGCNFGLCDQRIGMTWVSQNISNFGGDPEKITIGGQSAGGCSIHVHALEAKLHSRRPLFRRAIIQSGAIGTLGPITMETADINWEKLCKQCAIHIKGEDSRLEQLRSMTAADLLCACRNLKWITFPVVVDGVRIKNTELDCEVTTDFGNCAGELPVRLDPRDELIEVLIGDTESEGMMFYHPISRIQSFEEVQSIFDVAFSSDQLADEVLQAYQMTSSLTPAQLHQNLIRFVNDVMFGYPVYRARKFFASHQPVDQNIRNTTVEAYKVRFGNPFPGANHGVAHHCVDMIYQFDAFHDALRAADSTEFSSEECVEPTAASPSTTDSGYASPADLTASNPLSIKMPLTSFRSSNADLVWTIQQNWVNFINGNGIAQRHEVSGYGKDKDVITVYNKDRTVSVESLLTNPRWIEERDRLETIGKHPDAMKSALTKLTQGLMM